MADLISAVVCTFNRAELLKRALQSLCQQTLDRSQYEIIVVDNNSTDHTLEVVGAIQGNHPECNIVLVHEPLLGLAHARNMGFRHARAQYVAFMDDDAVAHEDWLQQALGCFEGIQPTPLVVGGRIFPIYDARKPEWFRDEYEMRDWGDTARFLTRGETFSGSNMVFNKDVLEAYGGFDTRVGVKAGSLSVGEEAILFDRMWRAAPDDSSMLYYSPRLVVSHSVPAYKMTVSYRLRRSFAEGQVWPIRHGPLSLAGRLSVVAAALRAIARQTGRALVQVGDHDTYRNWIVEAFAPVAIEIGRLGACFGFSVRVQQR